MEKWVILEKGREKLAQKHNPWIYSGAVRKTSENIEDGDVVAVKSAGGEFIAWGHYNSKSGIRVRLLSWAEPERPDEAWISARIADACSLRKGMITSDTTIVRLIYSESDMLPGIVCDIFGKVGVMQVSTPGFDKIKPFLAKKIAETAGLDALFERSDGDGRKIEGLPASNGLLFGKLDSEKIVARENGLLFSVDLTAQKTGFYADQRDNRRIFGEYAFGEMVDICAYSGAFSVYALKNSVKHSILLDISKESEALVEENMKLNSIGRERYEFVRGDAFELIRTFAKEGRSFDSIVLDPPKLAPSNKYLEKGLRAYKDLNLKALNLLKRSGVMATFSCSGAVTLSDFRSAVAFAAHDAGREISILKQLHQAPDHPIRLAAPETEYLKGLLLK